MSVILQKGNCLELMKQIPDKSIDLIFADLPYGTTKCKWDSIIPLSDYVEINGENIEKDMFYLKNYKSGISLKDTQKIWEKQAKQGLWSHYNRIIKDNGAILLFAQTPFDKMLGISNLKMLRYEWIFEKTSATGHLNAKKMPMKAHENILVFYKKLPTYNPQMTKGHNPVHSFVKKAEVQNKTEIYGITQKDIMGGGNTTRYPRDVLTFSSDKQTSHLHPTQKPLELCRYMIRTYTNKGDTVLDNCMGSGTCGVAAIMEERKFLGIEKDEKYFDIAKKRINKIRKKDIVS